MTEPGDITDGGSGRRLRQALARRIVWMTDGRRDASGQITKSPALVAVLGREHYSERRRQYPILSRRDLDGVLKQELAGGPPTLTVVSAAREDKREVTFFEFKPEVRSQVAPAFMLVPESMALAATLPAGRVATVERAGFRYFLASGGVSQPAGGAVTSAELFAMAAGLDASDAVTIAGDGLYDRIVSGLGQLKPETWLQLRMPLVGQRVEIDWQPIAMMAGVGLVVYLALASGYLAVTREAREKELAGLGGEVENLLVAQRDVDRMLSEQAGLAAVMADRRHSYRLWQVVSVAWSKGAKIKSVELRDATLTVRGDAAVATDVLAAIDAIPGFADAKFSAPVRGGRSGREDFSLVVTMQPEADRG